MKRISPALLVLGLLLLAGRPALAQSAGDKPEPPKPPVLPRVVGQAQTQEELDSWNALDKATELKEKETLAKQFLTDYPDSGLTPYVHYTLATSYRRANQNERFVEAAEKALLELSLPEVSSDLAFLYAETGRGDKAVERARQTLDALARMDGSNNTVNADWAKACHRARANAAYALGRVELDHSMSLEGEEARNSLSKAAEYLEESIREDPENPYPAFRLGQALTNLGRLDDAIASYARAASVGGVIEPFARQKLAEVYQYVHKDLKGLETAIQQQGERVKEAVAARAEELRRAGQQDGSTGSGALVPAKPPL